MLNVSNRGWLFAVAVLFLVITFQIINIPLLNMHPDEELSYRATRKDFAYTLWYQTSVHDNQAPLWFMTFWSWQQLVGQSEFTSRILGILLTMPALALLYQLARKWFRSPRVALFAMAILCVNSFYFMYALDIRPYPMVILSATVSVWMFQRWLERPTRRTAFFYGLSLALMLYVHYLLVFLMMAQALYLVLFRQITWQRVRQGVGAVVLAALIWLPWFPTFINQVVGLRQGETQSGMARGIAGIGVSTRLTDWATVVDFAQLATNGIPWLYLLVLAVGLIFLWRKAGFRLALMWAIVVPLIMLVFNLVVAVYAHRFLSHITVPLALALAASLAFLPSHFKLGARSIHIPQFSLLALAVFVGANVLTFTALLPVRVPYRDLYRTISALSQPGDVVLFNRGGEEDGFVDWQVKHYMTRDLRRNVLTDLQEALPARRIWYLTGDWFNDGVQAMFSEIERTHPLQEVLGQCNRDWCYLAQLMEAPPQSEPSTFGGELPFYGADIDHMTSTTVDVRLWWKAEQPPEQDYSIGLHLLNAAGVLVAQTDGPINHYGNTVQTSQMQPEQIYMDTRSVPLPANLPPGEYRLELVVYQSWDNVRLTLPDDSDTLILQSINLPHN